MTDAAPNPYAAPRPLIELAPELTTFTPVIQGSGPLSWSDFKSGMRLAHRWTANGLVGYCLVAFGCFMIVASDGWRWDDSINVVFVVLAGIYAARWYRTRRGLYRLWAHPLGPSAPHTISASPEGLLIRNDHSIALLGWEKINRFRLNTRVLLLIYEPFQSWQVVPRSYFRSDHEWHAFVDLVQAQVPQG